MAELPSWCKLFVNEGEPKNTITFSPEELEQIRNDSAGKVLIFRNYFDKQMLREMRRKIHENSVKTGPAGNLKYTDKTPNHFKMLDKPLTADRPEFRRLFQYFIWNKSDPAEVDQIGQELVHARNSIAGLAPETGLDLSTGYYTAFMVTHYPAGKGFLCPHIDGGEQKVEVIIMMSQYGEDYTEGGLFFFNHENKHCFADPYTQMGDLVVMTADHVHGVYGVDPHKPYDEKSEAGRWMLFTPLQDASLLNRAD